MDFTSDANSRPVGRRMKNSGRTPSRSRESTSRSARRSHNAMAHWPLKREKHSSPHSSQACTITSVSLAVRKV